MMLAACAHSPAGNRPNLPPVASVVPSRVPVPVPRPGQDARAYAGELTIALDTANGRLDTAASNYSAVVRGYGVE